MDERDWDLLVIIGAMMFLAVANVLEGREFRRMCGRVQAMEADVEFLKVVARETEARRGD